MSWRSLLCLTGPAVVGLILQSERTGGITALRGGSAEMKMMAGLAAAPHLYHKREGTHGTVTAPLDWPKVKNTTTPYSTVCWRASWGVGEETEALGGWMRTVTLPPKAAPEDRLLIVTIAGHLATVQRRMTLCHRTLSWRQSSTAGVSRLQTDIALQNLPDRRDTGPLNQPWGLSHTPAHIRQSPTHYRGAERTETEAKTWWVICSRNKDFLPL